MGLFSRRKKEKKVKLSPQETAFKIAGNVFRASLMSDETIIKALNGKGAATNRIFSAGVLGATRKRLLYYYQAGSQTGVENIMYNKILSVTKIDGYSSDMGSYIGVSIKLANGVERVVRCLDNETYNNMINDMIFYIEEKR